MSKISISSNPSGTATYTITAPAGSTDRTLTLPDAAGAVVIDEAGGGSVKIDSNGNVGIGIAFPQSDLDIVSKTTGTDAVIGLTAAGTRRYEIKTLTSDGALSFVDNSPPIVSERMRIDSAGRVTMPYQPAFLAYNAPASYVTGDTIVWSSTALNRGSVYNTSNGRFTAPVNGLYQFFASVRIETGIANASYHRLTFLHNGSQIQWSLSRLNFHLNGYYSHASNDQVVSMSAGDYVEVKFQSSLSSITTGAPNEHIFYGYLIG